MYAYSVLLMKSYLFSSKQIRENIQMKGEREIRESQSEDAQLKAPFTDWKWTVKLALSFLVAKAKGENIPLCGRQHP